MKLDIDMSESNIHAAIKKTVAQGYCGDSACAPMYSYDGKRCVIGHMLDEANLDKLLACEDTQPIDCYEVYDSRYRYVGADMIFLQELQEVHDSTNESKWKASFNEVLVNFGYGRVDFAT